MPPAPSRIDFLAPVAEVARALVGACVTVDGVGGRIVEVEAYDGIDPASHAHAGPTPRNASMFGPPGHLYVYRSYGIHWCMNFVCAERGHGAGVLIRALEPVHGIDRMRVRRGLDELRLLCAGPGRLCQALGIDRRHDGCALDAAPFRLEPATGEVDVVTGPRIGISKAVDVPWRFGLARSRFLSRPFPAHPPRHAAGVGARATTAAPAASLTRSPRLCWRPDPPPRSPTPMQSAYSANPPTRAEVDALTGATVLEFGTDWCGWCRGAQAAITSALAERPGIRHLKVEDGPGRPLGRSFKVKLWPTLVFMKNGQELARLVRPQEARPIADALALIDG